MIRSLKPCPFCGGEVVLRKTHMLDDIYFFVMCLGCNKATNAFPLDEEAIKAWNTRKEEPNE